MYKIFLYFLIFMSTFAIDKVNIKQLDTKVKNDTTYATMKSLNKVGADIKKLGDIYKVTTDIGIFTLKGNKIITPKKEYKYLSLPYEVNNQVFYHLM